MACADDRRSWRVESEITMSTGNIIALCIFIIVMVIVVSDLKERIIVIEQRLGIERTK